MNIFLHTNDLRVQDNVGLTKAAEDNPTLSVYVHDPRRHITGNKETAIQQRLHHLHEEYDEQNGSLLVKEGKTEAVLKAIIDKHDVNSIYTNERYDPVSKDILYNVDQATDTPMKQFLDQVTVSPKQYGNTPSSFSQYYNVWKKLADPTPVSNPDDLVDIETTKPELPDNPQPAPPGMRREDAVQAWYEFRDQRLSTYKDERDNVSNPDSVSRLSPYYAIGVLSSREVLDDVEAYLDETDDSDATRNAAKYRFEVAWRAWYKTVLAKNPSSVTDNYKDMKPVNWRNDDEEIEAWKNGRTGVPFVDAGIRELRNTGYMHNRLRQNVASFLTKHLAADWRFGRDFFAEHLFDHDIASNTGNWQWSASTGTDSVPIRIFNPEKQGRQYDPDAKYIKQWVPELRGVNPDKIHRWTQLDSDTVEALAPDYTPTIIDYDKRYHDGKQRFKNALNN